MTKLCSTKRAAGSVFYPCVWPRRTSDTTLRPCTRGPLRATKAFEYAQLEALSLRAPSWTGGGLCRPARAGR